jgi:peptidoglycan/LPS O-acetylase OafA/YrhL
VLIYHAGEVYDFAPIFPKAYLAVDFFFMLSGFVLAMTYEARLGRGLGPFAFVWRRIVRLWPLVTLGALIGLASFDDRVPVSLALLSAVFLVPLLRGADSAYLLNGPTWSITFELMLNALHGFLLYRLPTRWLLTLCALLIPVMFRCIAQFDGIEVGFAGDNFWWGIPRALLPYAIGIVLFRLGPTRVPGWLAAGVLLIALVFGQGPLFDLAFVLFICPLVVVSGVNFRAGKIGDILGKMSFPLYALHRPILSLAPLGIGLGLSVGLALAIGLVEPYLRRLRHPVGAVA